MLAPQLLGGTFGWSVTLIALLAAASVAAGSIAALRRRASPRASALVWLSLIAVAWTGLQAIPLPESLVAAWHPDVVGAARAMAELRGAEPPAWLPLSYSPHGTRAEVVKGLAVACTLIAAWLAVAGGRRKQVIAAVAASVATMGVVALGHLVFDADRVFGLYAPVELVTPLLAPVMNQNHLGGFLAIGPPLFVGFALATDDRGRRAALVVGAVLVGATSLLAVSRGAFVSLVLGLAVFALLGVARGRGSSTAALTAGAALVLGLALGLFVASDAFLGELHRGDLSKLELAGRALTMSLEHPFLGVGRGGFSAAFVALSGADVRYTHPESFPAQWATEWGLPFAAALLVAGAAALVRGARQSRDWTRVGAVAALCSLAAHELVDFATELSGVAVVAAALLGAAVAPRDRRKPETRGRVAHLGLVAAALGGLAAVLLGPAIDRDGVASLRRRLERAMADGDHDTFRATLEIATQRHPLEPIFPLLAGAEAVQRGDDGALPWLNRAMQLAPGWDAPHEWAGRWLIGRGRVTQGFLELREAQERRSSGPTVACETLRQRPDAGAEFARIASDHEGGLAWMEAVATCLPLDSAAARAIDAELTEQGADGGQWREARRALAAGDPERALEVLAQVSAPDAPEARLLEARAHIARGAPEAARRAVAEAATWTRLATAGLEARARAEAAAGDLDAMRASTEELRGHSAGRAEGLARVWVLEGELEESAGQHGRAIAAYERAERLHPSVEGATGIARASEAIGHLARATRVYDQLCRTQGETSAACAARDRVRQRARESLPLAPQLRVPQPPPAP